MKKYSESPHPEYFKKWDKINSKKWHLNQNPNERTVSEDQKFNTFLSLIDMYVGDVKKQAFPSRILGV